MMAYCRSSHSDMEEEESCCGSVLQMYPPHIDHTMTFEHIVYEDRAKLAIHLNPPDQRKGPGWKRLAERLGFDHKHMKYIESLKDESGCNTLIFFDKYGGNLPVGRVLRYLYKLELFDAHEVLYECLKKKVVDEATARGRKFPMQHGGSRAATTPVVQREVHPRHPRHRCPGDQETPAPPRANSPGPPPLLPLSGSYLMNKFLNSSGYSGGEAGGVDGGGSVLPVRKPLPQSGGITSRPPPPGMGGVPVKTEGAVGSGGIGVSAPAALDPLNHPMPHLIKAEAIKTEPLTSDYGQSHAYPNSLSVGCDSTSFRQHPPEDSLADMQQGYAGQEEKAPFIHHVLQRDIGMGQGSDLTTCIRSSSSSGPYPSGNYFDPSQLHVPTPPLPSGYQDDYREGNQTPNAITASGATTASDTTTSGVSVGDVNMSDVSAGDVFRGASGRLDSQDGDNVQRIAKKTLPPSPSSQLSPPAGVTCHPPQPHPQQPIPPQALLHQALPQQPVLQQHPLQSPNPYEPCHPQSLPQQQHFLQHPGPLQPHSQLPAAHGGLFNNVVRPQASHDNAHHQTHRQVAPLGGSDQHAHHTSGDPEHKFNTVPRGSKEGSAKERSGHGSDVRRAESSAGRIMTGPGPNFRETKIFVTYCRHSASSRQHDRVAKFAKTLCKNGFVVTLQEHPPAAFDGSNEDWVRHCFQTADMVVMCITPEYLMEVSAAPPIWLPDHPVKAEPGTANMPGPMRRTREIFQMILRGYPSAPRRYLAVLMKGASPSDVPQLLQGVQTIRWPDRWEDVLFCLSRPQHIMAQYRASERRSQSMGMHVSRTCGEREGEMCYTR